MIDLSDFPKPLGYGLLNVDTGKLRPTTYVHPETAAAGAAAKTSRYTPLVAVPLFGPEALVAYAEAAAEEARKARVLAAALENAEKAVRAEVIALRNQLAEIRGRELAEKHAKMGES